MTPSLPPRPDLDHLKKQAKALLKAHNRRDGQACETLRRLHRFSNAPDLEILSAEVSLGDVQYALAMDYGFKSWPELKKHVEAEQKHGTREDATHGGTFSEREAWAAVHQGVEDFQQLPDDVRSRLLSITVAGSLVRGDFLESRSGVDIYTVYDPVIEKPWNSEAHARVRPCFDRHFAPYRSLSVNPNAWDDVCVEGSTLPREPDQVGPHRLKGLGIYYFDFVKHHRTVWGEDFTRSLLEPADPRPLVPERLDWLIERANEIAGKDPADRGPMPIIVVEAMRALQIYFSEEPSIHKSEVIRRYKAYVPDFTEKPFALTVWDDYLRQDAREHACVSRPPEDYLIFLQAAKRLVQQNPLR